MNLIDFAYPLQSGKRQFFLSNKYPKIRKKGLKIEFEISCNYSINYDLLEKLDLDCRRTFRGQFWTAH